MSDPIQQHLKGYAASLAAMDLIRKGTPPGEAASRLLVALGGDSALRYYSDKQIKKLSNKLNWSAQAVIRSCHSVQCAFTDSLRQVGVLEPLPDDPLANLAAKKPSAHIDAQ
jgi:hypothetical protein